MKMVSREGVADNVAYAWMRPLKYFHRLEQNRLSCSVFDDVQRAAAQIALDQTRPVRVDGSVQFWLCRMRFLVGKKLD